MTETRRVETKNAQASWEHLREEIERSEGSVVVVDVIDVDDGVSPDGLGDALVPSRVDDGRRQVVHPRRVRIRLGLGSEDGRVEDVVGDVLILQTARRVSRSKSERDRGGKKEQQLTTWISVSIRYDSPKMTTSMGSVGSPGGYSTSPTLGMTHI
jgi:hypothetical protein